MLYSADTQYQYDAQGNRTQHTEHNGETQRYYYNQLNQLQRVDRYSADNRLTRSLYRYDPLGRRLVKQVEHYRIDSNQLHEAAEPEVEFYGWDGDRLAFTQTADSQWHIIYEPESFTPLLQLQHATDAPISEQDKVLAEVMGSLQSTLNYLPAHEAYELARTVRERTVAQLKANEQWQTPELPEECYFYHCNHLGLPEALTNQKGEAVWAASYDAWGTIKEEHNPNNLHQPIRLPGQYHDTETGLYYNRHRYYDPKLGSYISQDPIGLASGEPNLMAYPRNPVQGVDPLGLRTCWPDEYGQTVCTSGSPYPVGYNPTGENASRDITFNNARYNQCYNTCINEDINMSTTLTCTIAGAGVAALSKSEKAGTLTGEVCELVVHSSQCSMQCEGLERAKADKNLSE